MRKTSLCVIILLLAITACTVQPAIKGTEVAPTATSTLPDPQVFITPAPDIEQAIQGFMTAWAADDYETMYAYLSDESRNAISIEDFSDRYRNSAVAMTLEFGSGIDYEIMTNVTNPNSALSSVNVTYNTYLFGSLSRQIAFPLVRESEGWRFSWDESLILPELIDGNILEIVRETTPRGNIYANDGSPIAAQEDVVAIGFTPGGLNSKQMGLFYQTMSKLSIYQIAEIVEMVENAYPTDYVSLGEASQSEVDRHMKSLNALSGVFLNYYSSRFYYDGGIAPQAVGHLTYISEDDQYEYLRRGYSINERFGGTGLERAFENELSGERGASLYLKSPDGQIISKLAQRSASPGQSITTTIDPTLQYYLQQSLGKYRGAIVVMEIDTGRVLAIVSNPQFDPNLFDFQNQNYVYVDNPYFQPNDPVFNRATSGQYPLGSVFKIISMAAALETGVFTPESEIYCGHTINACGNEYYDWTLEKERPPSGDLNLPEGLMRSCNPWFYYIGEQLYYHDFTNSIADLARDFGLGRKTGIEIPEEAGNIPERTDSCEANVQLSIGQGDMTVTPLQVAQFLAAVGNGGTLYKPSLVESIGFENEEPTHTFEPEILGKLPVTEEHLEIISEAMRWVIKEARGTAHRELGGMPYRAHGKTGTAQNPFGTSHAWFAGFTRENRENKPDIAIAVVLENAGEGSEMAAPVFRRVVSLYFSDYTSAGITLPWEAFPYVVASLTPIPSDTPVPTNTPWPTETPIVEEIPDETPHEEEIPAEEP